MTSDEYRVVDVTAWRVASLEPRGGGPNTWLDDPEGSGRWLYKPVTTVAWGQQGEDRAEKTSCEIASVIGVPRAEVQLAVRSGVRGIISHDLAPPPWELHTGAVLLSGTVPSYTPGTEGLPGRPGHSLSNIRLSLASIGPPPDTALPSGFTAFDVFAGFLLLDALVANRDRHDENWAVLRPPSLTEPDLLCPSYDHGSSVGFNLTEVRQRHYLDQGGIQAWASKGDAHRFEHTSKADRPTLVELAAHGLQAVSADVRDFWRQRLLDFTQSDARGIVERLPEVSEVCRTFTVELLMINRGRLLDVC